MLKKENEKVKLKLMVMLATVSAILVALFTASATFALPSYATATGQPCSTCHVNPAGGGTLTATGQAFQAIPTHATNPAAAFAQVSAPKAAPAPAPTAAPTAAPAAAAAPTAAAATTTAATTATTLP